MYWVTCVWVAMGIKRRSMGSNGYQNFHPFGIPIPIPTSHLLFITNRERVWTFHLLLAFWYYKFCTCQWIKVGCPFFLRFHFHPFLVVLFVINIRTGICFLSKICHECLMIVLFFFLFLFFWFLKFSFDNQNWRFFKYIFNIQYLMN